MRSTPLQTKRKYHEEMTIFSVLLYHAFRDKTMIFDARKKLREMPWTNVWPSSIFPLPQLLPLIS